MEAGLQIFNENNHIQIDSKFENYLLTAKGTMATSVSAGYNDTWFVVTIPTNFKDSMCAVRCTVEFAVLNGRDSSGNITHRVLTKSPTTFEYWLFSAAPVGDFKYGLEVYNGEGKRVFSAAAGYLKPLYFNTILVTRGSNERVWQTVNTPDKNCAFMFTAYTMFLDGNTVPIPGGGIIAAGEFKLVSARTTGTGAQYHVETLNHDNIFRGVTDKGIAGFFLVDVDGLV